MGSINRFCKASASFVVNEKYAVNVDDDHDDDDDDDDDNFLIHDVLLYIYDKSKL